MEKPGLGTREAQELVTRAQNGDGAAFVALYEHFSPKLYRYLYYRLDGRAESAEDLTAEVFFKAYEKLDSYEFRGLPFSSWLYRIAHNHLVDHVRAQRRAPVVPLNDAMALPAKRAELDLERSISRQELTWALGRLTPERRQVLVLRFLEGLSVHETATALSKTEAAIKKLQVRGLDDLRRIMDLRPVRKTAAVAEAMLESIAEAPIAVAV